MKAKLHLIPVLLIVSVSVFGYTYYSEKSQLTKNETKIDKENSKNQIVERSDSTVKLLLIKLLTPFKNAKTMFAKYKTVLIDANSGHDLVSFDCVYAKCEKGIYQRSIESENLITENYLLALDQESKSIFIEDNYSGPDAILESSFLFDLNSIMLLNDSFLKHREITSEISSISINLNLGNYYKVEFYFNSKIGEIKEIRLYPFSELFELPSDEGEISSTNPIGNINIDNVESSTYFISLKYSEIEIDEKISDKWFDIGRYVKFSNGIPKGINSYKNYEIDYEK